MTYKDDIKRQRKARKRREKRRERARSKPLTFTVPPCDGCTACCTCVAVSELRKGFYTPCSFCDGNGCTTYRNRPPSCSVYHCAYSAGLIPHRPDECGLLFSPEYMLGTQILCVYEVQPDAIIGKLNFIFEVANRIADRGVVMDRILLYRHGAEIPTDWGGQHYRLKMVTWGDPNVVGQLWFTVRTDHEEEDEQWWLEALVGCTETDRSADVEQERAGETANLAPEA